jgi:PAS domain S-box-containing protein
MNKISPQPVALEIKKSMLDSLIRVVLVIGLPALIFNIINSRNTGNFPYMSLIGIALLMIFAIFRKTPFLLKAWVMITIGYLIGTRGLLNEGLLSDGLLYYIFISILASMLINIRSGITITVITLMTTGLITFSISKNWITYDLDIITYFHSPSTWLAFVFTTALFTSMAVFIYGHLEKYLVQYINELTLKTDTLNRSNLLLENEISERHLAVKQLEQSEIKFRNVFNSIGEGIVLLKKDRMIMDINEGFLKMTGLNRESILNNHFETLFTDPEKLKGMLKPAQSIPSIFKRNEHQLKTKRKHQYTPVEVTWLPFHHNPEIIHIALIKDITEKKENEIKIMNAIISSEESERFRIAQDLHDGIGPYLSAAKLYINSLGLADTDNKSVHIKKELAELMNLSINTIREISGNLGSQVLRSLGLNAALQSFIEKVRTQDPVNFKVTIPDKYPFLENVEIALYRILVELINNSLKYGAPKNITLKLAEKHDHVSINYREDGVGFDLMNVLDKHTGMGLYNIHSRISSLGGTIDYFSSPGNGVTVTMTFKRSEACKSI